MKVNEAFPEWMAGGGIFTALESKDVPWKGLGLAASLDLEYHGNISGDKRITPLVKKLTLNGVLSSDAINKLSDLIVSLYGRNWSKLWDTLSFEYDPIENYRMIEQMTDDSTVINYGKEIITNREAEHTKTGEDVNTSDLSVKTSDSSTTENIVKTDGETELSVKTSDSSTTENTVKTDGETELSVKTSDSNTTENTVKTDGETELSVKTSDSNTTENTVKTDGETGLSVKTSDSGDNNNAVYGFNSTESVPTAEQKQTAEGSRSENGTNSETRTENGTQTAEGSRSENGTNSEARTENGAQTAEGSRSENGTNSEARTENGTQTAEGSRSENGTNNIKYNTTESDIDNVTEKVGGTDTTTHNYNLTRSGNIGVTTSQQMITSERDLWIWNFFIDTVFPNVSNVIALKIY